MLERIIQFYTGIETQYKIDINVNYKTVREHYIDSHFNKLIIGEGISWDQIKWLELSLDLSQTKELVYAYKKIYNALYLTYNIAGDIGKHFSYTLSTTKTKYFELPKNEYMDNEYWIGNIDFTYNINNRMSLSNGVRYNNYEFTDNSKHIGFFSNFSLEYKEDSFIYVGFKTTEDEINDSFQTDYRSAYLKFSYALN